MKRASVSEFIRMKPDPAQGSRLTAWELQQSGIDVTTICDNMAAVMMQEGKSIW